MRLVYGVDSSLQYGELRLPADGAGGGAPWPLVIVVHGGYWYNTYNLGLMNDMCEALAAAGIASWNVEYRRAGDAGGGWPGTFLDLAQSADALPSLFADHNIPVDLRRVVALGHSAGGHLALWLAARHCLNSTSVLRRASPALPLLGVVNLAGVSDLIFCEQFSQCASAVHNFLGGASSSWPQRYAEGSPAELLPMGVPSITLHGTRDGAVPPGMSDRWHARSLAAGDSSTLITLAGASHFEVIQPRSKEFTSVLEATRSLLGLKE